MQISVRAGWTLLHGALFGGAFLLAFASGLAGLHSLRPEGVTAEGNKQRLLRLKVGLWGMALVAWCAVLSGTFILYPWYAAQPSQGADLHQFPRSLLLSQPATADWNNFGMEWKEHVAWLAPMAATVVAFAVTYYGSQLAKKTGERRAIMILCVAAFMAAGVAGVFGSFINKIAPVW